VKNQTSFASCLRLRVPRNQLSIKQTRNYRHNSIKRQFTFTIVYVLSLSCVYCKGIRKRVVLLSLFRPTKVTVSEKSRISSRDRTRARGRRNRGVQWKWSSWWIICASAAGVISWGLLTLFTYKWLNFNSPDSSRNLPSYWYLISCFSSHTYCDWCVLISCWLFVSC